MNSKHRKTLVAVFTTPTLVNIEWARIEALLVAVGCETIEGRGSRVRFARDGKVMSFHRPHPDNKAKAYQVEDARKFLQSLGVTP